MGRRREDTAHPCAGTPVQEQRAGRAGATSAKSLLGGRSLHCKVLGLPPALLSGYFPTTIHEVKENVEKTKTVCTCVFFFLLYILRSSRK